MYAKQLITVNWGNLETRAWPLSRMTLLTGETGSGKTTLEDAIQTVMTAAMHGVFHYNIGQDEVAQASRTKDKRTLQAYALGGESNLYARASSNTYVALVFEPDEDEEEMPFTAVAAIEALLDGTKPELSRLGLYIVRKRALSLAHFCEGDSVTRELRVVPVREFWVHIQQEIGRDMVDYFQDNKGRYVEALYGAFLGKSSVSTREATRAARAFVKAIAYKPVGSIDELVKQEILDAEDMTADLRKVSDLMRNIHDLRVEAERLTKNIAGLEEAHAQGTVVLSTYGTQLALNAAQTIRSRERDEADIQRYAKEIEQAEAQMERLAQEVEQLNADEHSLHEELAKLRARLSAIPAANEKGQRERELADAFSRLDAARGALEEALFQLENLLAVARAVTQLPADALSGDLANAHATVAERLKQATRLSAKRLTSELAHEAGEAYRKQECARIAESLIELEAPAVALAGALATDEDSFAGAAERERASLCQQRTDVVTEMERLSARIRRLATGKAAIPLVVEQAVRFISETIPGARPQVLCELVEPKPDTPWQNVIEAYMGADRFTILVDEDTEREAIDCVRERPEFKRGVKVAQGRRAKRETQGRTLPRNSIVEELDIRHPTAKAYVEAAYGGVLKVPNTEALRDARRGVTLDGKGAAGYGMFPCWIDEADCVFGAQARELARRRAEEELAQRTTERNRLEERVRDLKVVAAQARQAVAPAFAVQAQTLAREAARAATAREALARLDLTEANELLAEQAKLTGELGQIKQTLTIKLTENGELKTAQRNAAEEKAKLERGLPERVAQATAAIDRLEEYAGAGLGRVDAESLKAEAHTLAREFSLESLNSRVGDARLKLNDAVHGLNHAIERYNGHARENERIAFMPFRPSVEAYVAAAAAVAATLTMLEVQLKNQRDIGIAENLEQLKAAEADFNHVFTSDFCFRIRRAVKDGVETLRDMNKELSALKFGTDRFHLEWDWVDEYRGYFDFFEAIYAKADDLGKKSIFDEGVLPPDQAAIGHELRRLLLQPDRETAERRLRDIADYRNYRRYEIIRTSDNGSRVRLSTWGTGSGGQLETPFYVVRSAVVAHAFRLFGKHKGSRLRMVLSDEAFAKMDEARSRAVIRYFRDTLKLQLIVAMPTSKSGAVKPEFDREYTFARVQALLPDGRVWETSEAHEKILKRSALEAMWDETRESRRQAARETFLAENSDVAAELEAEPSASAERDAALVDLDATARDSSLA